MKERMISSIKHCKYLTAPFMVNFMTYCSTAYYGVLQTDCLIVLSVRPQNISKPAYYTDQLPQPTTPNSSLS